MAAASSPVSVEKATDSSRAGVPWVQRTSPTPNHARSAHVQAPPLPSEAVELLRRPQPVRHGHTAARTAPLPRPPGKVEATTCRVLDQPSTRRGRRAMRSGYTFVLRPAQPRTVCEWAGRAALSVAGWLLHVTPHRARGREMRDDEVLSGIRPPPPGGYTGNLVPEPRAAPGQFLGRGGALARVGGMKDAPKFGDGRSGRPGWRLLGGSRAYDLRAASRVSVTVRVG